MANTMIAVLVAILAVQDCFSWVIERKYLNSGSVPKQVQLLKAELKGENSELVEAANVLENVLVPRVKNALKNKANSLDLDDIAFNFGEGSAQSSAKFSQISVKGISSAMVDNVDANLMSGILKIDVSIPLLVAKGQYNLDSGLFVFTPKYGSGSFVTTLNDVKVNVIFGFRPRDGGYDAFVAHIKISADKRVLVLGDDSTPQKLSPSDSMYLNSELSKRLLAQIRRSLGSGYESSVQNNVHGIDISKSLTAKQITLLSNHATLSNELLNELIDAAVARLQKLIRDHGLDPRNLPEITIDTGVAGISIQNGTFQGLSNINNDRFVLELNDDEFIISGKIANPLITVGYDYSAHLIGVKTSGIVSARLEGVAIYISARVATDRSEAKLEDYGFPDIGEVKIEFTGADVIGKWAADSLEWLINKAIDVAVFAINEPLRLLIEQVLRWVVEL